MTSHITVSAATAATGPTGLASAGKSQESGPLGGFGAILDGLQAAASGSTPGAAPDATSSQPPAANAGTGFVQMNGDASSAASASSENGPSILDLIARLLGEGFAGTEANASAAVPLDATVATADTASVEASTDTGAGTPPKLLKDVIEALKAIDKAQQGGGPITDDMLKKAKKAIDALAGFLAAQQPVTAAAPAAGATPDNAGPAPPAAAVDSVTTPDTLAGRKTAAELATAKASLNVLAAKIGALSSQTANVDPDLAGKLRTLAKSLDPSALSADTIRDLGLTGTDAAADPKLAGDISGLVNGKAQSATATQPPLAAPRLTLPGDTALGAASTDDKGKPTGIVHRAETAAPTGSSTSTSTASPSGAKTSDRPPGDGDRKPSTPLAAGTTSSRPADAVAAGSDAAAASPAAANAPAAAAASAVALNAAARTAQTAYQQAALPAQVNLPQLAFEVVRHVQQGQNHFQIRLDPADMGRVDVRLAIDPSGAVNARLTVERPETLDLLRRDAAQLGQAFTQAGLDGSKTNLQFSLSQNPFTRQDNGGQQSGSFASGMGSEDTAEAADATVTAATIYRGTANVGALNLFV